MRNTTIRIISIATIIFVVFNTNALSKEVRYGPVIYSTKNVANRYSKTLTDISAQLPANNIYKDRTDEITSAHEMQHGICSKYRLQYKVSGLTNAFYMLGNQVNIITGPNTTLAQIAPTIPQSLRGSSYNLYMISQQRYWNREPCYILEEWTCYMYGARVRSELNIVSRRETVRQMVEFMVYSICMVRMRDGDANYTNSDEYKKLRSFTKLLILRCASVYHANMGVGDISDSTAYLEKIKQTNIYPYMLELLK